MSNYQFILIIVLCVFIGDLAWGQSRSQRDRQMQSRVVFFETVLVPSEKENLTRIDINYRIMKNFFVFTRSSSGAGESAFEGEFELGIEIFDSHGQSRTRQIDQQRLYSDTPTLEFPNIDFIEGSFSFELPQDEYRLLIQLNDRNSQRRYVDRDTRITIPSHPEGKPAIYDVLFIEPVDRDTTEKTLRAVNLGGNLFFGKDAHGVVSFKTLRGNDNPPDVTVRIHRLFDGQRPRETILSETIPHENIFPGTLLGTGNTGESIHYHLAGTENTGLHTAIFQLHGESLEEGNYRIQITVENNNEAIEHTETFSVIWIDKPASLRNFDFALEMLEYIMSPEDYRELRRGSSDERRRKFSEYWKEKDPEPQTAFNPVITEYYRRVDHAANEFTTIQERNGARTDRGKIYILYGPPTEKNRSLTPGQAPQETWIYKHLNQKFIFVDQSRQGNYRLTTREEL